MGITSDIKPEKITSDLRFYEINTCEISIIKFLIENPNVIYQDHYKVKFNDYSLMKCFGLITGLVSIGIGLILKELVNSKYEGRYMSYIASSRKN